MAYTYEDFTKAAAEAGLSGSFDQEDLSLAEKYPEYGLSLVSLKRDLNNAQTNEQKLLVSEAANQLRSRYAGYGVETPSSAADTTAAKAAADAAGTADTAQEQSSDYIRLLNKVTNHDAFRYDPESDPIYSAYKKAYNREGDRAAANALAAAAAATGGRPSSYAATAAQQANNLYAGKLADIIPTLRGQALDEYSSEYSQLLQALSAAYQKERDKVADAQEDFENALRVYQLTGKITGSLKEYLKTGGSGGSGGGGGSGGYGGGGSDALQKTQDAVDAILDKYIYTSEVTGKPIGAIVTNKEDYELLKALLGYTDEEMQKRNVHNASTPEYQALAKMSDTAGNYKLVSDTLEDMVAKGASKDEVLATIRDAYSKGLTSVNDYTRLYNAYRDMDESKFGGDIFNSGEDAIYGGAGEDAVHKGVDAGAGLTSKALLGYTSQGGGTFLSNGLTTEYQKLLQEAEAEYKARQAANSSGDYSGGGAAGTGKVVTGANTAEAAKSLSSANQRAEQLAERKSSGSSSRSSTSSNKGNGGR